mmetsp:Transcript_10574/g.15266  ORF Transcript_10574/g.15266 Transcript_10574/m.15266 type:complete len:288 (-) Transcript_10574:194-1057(-)|eukprot:CAMPEP_0175100346 /NCGR_PEP_ID=MMETSP0086_2-20121207/7049_1 /TAXON_ID=136419 /ORGANISM="Unknown Unknown, Strain D1" /LENGTH=287 /DNA_ID=CAMNT_0016374473 /DNA_START=30 /DNA_END=893 /DNA_ORIENTATION=-
MDRLGNTKLVNKKGDEVYASEVLAGKAVLFYFSAHWCPPCRQFTPMLAKFYADAKAAGHPIEIVFVSADRSEKDMMAYFQNDHGDYFAVKYNQAATKQLGPELQVRGIPALHLVDQNGLPKLPADQIRNAVASGDVSAAAEWAKLCGATGGKDWKSSKGYNLSSAPAAGPANGQAMRAARLAALEARAKGSGAKEENKSIATANVPAKPAPTQQPAATAAAAAAAAVLAPGGPGAPKSAAAQPTASAEHDEKVAQLVAMGFDPEQSKHALESCAWNLDLALQLFMPE